MTRKLGALAVCVTAVLALAMPAAQASARKPFHCYYRYAGRSWVTFYLPDYVLHCDRNWN